MKKFSFIISSIIFTAVSLTTFSCSYDLIPQQGTSIGGGSTIDFSKTITPPSDVTASQGKANTIELSWSNVKNAASYKIFSADTPFSTFNQIGETKGGITTFTIQNLDVGITNSFIIKSVNNKGEESKGSKIVTGTTLDRPIISLIPESDGKSVSVDWWMGNCKADNYEDNIEFIVTPYICINDQDVKIADKEIVVKGNLREAVISGLLPRTNYKFEVTARTLDQQDSVTSTRESILSAHKTIPDAPVNLSITKGSNNSSVILSWELPEPVEYLNKSTKEYFIKPVYFTIERKLENEEDSSYETIVPYIGTVKNQGVKINCNTNSSSDSRIKVEGFAEGTSISDYPAYISGSKITYTDSSIAKGQLYSYRVKVLTDDVNSQNFDLAKTPVGIVTGWRLSEPVFKISGNINLDEEDKSTITSIDVNYHFELETFGTEYSYVIVRTQVPFSGTAKPGVVILQTNNIEEICNFKSTFSYLDNEDIHGFYTYKLYILNKTEESVTSEPSDFIHNVTASNKVSVTNDATLIPEIKGFTVEDGYSDKFKLSWEAVEGGIYTIRWTPYENGEAQEEQEKVLSESDYTISNKIVSFNHSAVSGDCRLYSLNITKSNIPASEVYKEISQTLGTANLTSETPEYNSIKVSWPVVQKNDTEYSITATYPDGKSVISNNINISEESNIVTCVIENPVGYNDFTKSGLPVTFKVTSKNTVTNNTTESSIIVKTLGPALINTKAETSNITDNKLQITWNKIEGATGYIIYRAKYKYNDTFTNWAFDKADKYYYDAAEDTTSASGKITNQENDTITNNRAKITLKDNIYTLVDYDCAVSNDKSSYEISQAQISWGLPYGYVVLPVKGGISDFTFGTGTNFMKVTGGEAEIIYTNPLSDKKTATTGYGLFVHAEKAQNAVTQKITWVTPYFNEKTPTLYRRLAGSTNNWKRVDADFERNGNIVNCTYDPKGQDFDAIQAKSRFSQEEYLAYEYAVKYGNSTGSTYGTFLKAYLDKLSSSMETNEDNLYKDENDIETLNKGYLMNIPFSANFGGTIHDGKATENDYQYSEKVEIEPWDYENRKIGPESYEIYIYNSDLGNEWLKVASANKDLSNFTRETLNDTTVEIDGTIVRLWPTNIRSTKNGTTSGPLKVIRDAKHYYKLAMKKENQDKSLSIGEDFETFGYRDITNEELTKTAMYVFAYGFFRNDGGNESLDNATQQFGWGEAGTTTGESGSATFSKKWYHVSTKYRANYSFSSFAPRLNTPSERYVVSPVAVSCDTKEVNIRGLADPYLFEFLNTHDITVSSGDKAIDIKYEGTINFKCSNNNSITLKLTRNGTTTTMVDTSDNGTRKRWFPMQIHGDKGYLFTSKDYGWWN